MRTVKPTHLYNNLVKLRLCGLKNTNLNKIKLRYFSLSSCFQSEKIVNVTTQLPFLTVSEVSKKNKRLSQVGEEDIEVVEDLKNGNIYYPFKNAQERGVELFRQQTEYYFKKTFKTVTGVDLEYVEQKYFDRFTDILIVGGGAVGLSIAFALRSKFPFGPKITVVDKDSSFPHASTNLGQGIVTQQLFSEEEEIEILRYGAEFFCAFSRLTEIEGKEPFKLSYDPLGTLILADSTNAEELLKRHERMKCNGIHNKILSQKILKQKFPWLNTEGVVFGSLAMVNEGVVDPWEYLIALRCKAYNLGVNFATAEVIDFGSVNGDIRRAICKLPDGTYNSIDFAHCVLAGGLETLNLVEVLNELSILDFQLKLPLKERMRYEYCLHSTDGLSINTPMVVDSDGTYFRRVGLTGHYVAGVPSVTDDADPYHIFESQIKPFLIKRTPQFCKIDLVRGWIDAYDYCISNNVGITGPHPETGRIIFALGFSHLGLQYLPALGRAVMELIYYDDYQTINFTPYHVEHLWRKQHLEADRRRRELLESQERAALTD